MFTADQGKLLNRECAAVLSSIRRKVEATAPSRHALYVMSNCKIALRYLQYIHQIAIEGYSPIAVSLFRTYYEIVCSTMYLAEHKDELRRPEQIPIKRPRLIEPIADSQDSEFSGAELAVSESS
jgi:hypothetical protein